MGFWGTVDQNGFKAWDEIEPISGDVPRFEAKQPVRWLAPVEVLRGANGEFFGGLFSKFSDNRARQALFRPPIVHAGPPEGPVDGELSYEPMPWLSQPDSQSGQPAPFTFDYAADIGDGFGATFALARLMAQPTIQVVEDGDERPTTLDRGELLVFGGDEVYPVSSPRTYRDRTIGPYSAAFNSSDRPPPPMFAIPGNHDWYDGLTAFANVFTRAPAEPEHRPGHPWTVHQTRSYFAVQLPGRWWIWGLDVGLDDQVDYHQMHYFRSIGTSLQPDDRIILCTGKPAWIHRTNNDGHHPENGDDPDSWDHLVEFLQATVGEDPWTRVRLVLSGDKHYYARHSSDDPAAPILVTAGGGGAYLSSTLDSPETIRLDASRHGQPSQPRTFARVREWPTTSDARLAGLSALFRLPPRNPEIGATIGVFYGLLAIASMIGFRDLWPTRPSRLWPVLTEMSQSSLLDGGAIGLEGVVWSFGGALFATILLGLLAVPAITGFSSIPARLASWLAHCALHVVALGLTMVLSAKLVIEADVDDAVLLGNRPGTVYVWRLAFIPLVAGIVMFVPVISRGIRFRVWEWDNFLLLVPAVLIFFGLLIGATPSSEPRAVMAFILGTSVLGGILGTWALTLYLVGAQFFRASLNELFVGLRDEGYKHFLRIQVRPEEVTVYAVGYRNVAPRTVRWRNGKPQPTGPTLPAFAPDEHELVDRFVVRRGRTPDQPPVRLDVAPGPS